MESKDFLKTRRLELKLSQLDIAKMVGVSEATVSRWESGNIANMKRDRIYKLSKALQIDPSVLIGFEPESVRESESPAITPAEVELLELHRQLNDEGQARLRDYADDLVSSGKYIKSDPLGLVAK